MAHGSSTAGSASFDGWVGGAPVVAIADTGDSFPPSPTGGLATVLVSPAIPEALASLAETVGATWLVEITWTTGIKRYAVVDIDALADPYEGRLIAEVSISRNVSDIFFGTIETSDVTAVLRFKDGVPEFLLDEDQRNQPWVLKRYDLTTGLVTQEWVGIVAQIEVSEKDVTVHGTDIDPSLFEQQFPRGDSAVDTTRWPNAVDVGAQIPLVNGNVDRMPLPFINNDPVNERFDYLMGYDSLSASVFYQKIGDTLFVIDALKVPKLDLATTKKFNASSQSFSHTVTGNGTTRALYVMVNTRSAVTVSSITWNGVALTKLEDEASSPITSEIWYLLNPARGTFNVAVTLSGSANCIATAASFNGVDSSLAPDNVVVATGTGTTASVTVNCADGELIVAFVTFNSIGAVNPTTSQTEMWNQWQQTANNVRGAGGYFIASGLTSKTMTWVSVASATYSIIGFRVKRGPTYTVSTSINPGYTTVRFDVPQVDFSNSFVPIHADVNGLQAERNWARAIKTHLSNTIWGLAQTVDATSFTEAESKIDTIGGLYCDGAIFGGTLSAQDFFIQLLQMRGMRLGRSAFGFTLTVDDVPESIRYHAANGPSTFADSTGAYVVKKLGPKTTPSIRDAASVIKLSYREDMVSSGFAFTISRTLRTFGQEKPFENRFIRDHATADKHLSYLFKTMKETEPTVGAEFTNVLADLQLGEVIALTDPDLGYDKRLVRVRTIEKKDESVVALLEHYSDSIYDYVQSVPFPPTNPTAASRDDYSKTPPDSATNLSVESTTTSQANDGTTYASAVVKFDTPIDNYARSLVRWRRNDTEVWSPTIETTQAGKNVRVTVEGLVPGQAYDFTVTIINGFDLPSLADPLVSNSVMPTDPTVPDTPSQPTLTALGGTNVYVGVPATPPADWGWTEIYRHTSNTFGSATLVQKGKTLTFFDPIGASGTFYYWAKIVDKSGNKSTESVSNNITV